MSKEFADAIDRLRIARQNLDWAEPEFISAAVFELAAAEAYMAAVFKMCKKGKEESAEVR